MEPSRSVKTLGRVVSYSESLVKILGFAFSLLSIALFLWMQQRISLSQWRDASHIKVQMLDNVGNRSTEIEIDDPATVSEFLQLLNSGSIRPDHDCGPVGYLTLVWDEKEIELPILPGHEQKFYEYRYQGRAYQMDRANWLSLVVPLGIPENALLDKVPLD